MKNLTKESWLLMVLGYFEQVTKYFEQVTSPNYKFSRKWKNLTKESLLLVLGYFEQVTKYFEQVTNYSFDKAAHTILNKFYYVIMMILNRSLKNNLWTVIPGKNLFKLRTWVKINVFM